MGAMQKRRHEEALTGNRNVIDYFLRLLEDNAMSSMTVKPPNVPPIVPRIDQEDELEIERE